MGSLEIYDKLKLSGLMNMNFSKVISHSFKICTPQRRDSCSAEHIRENLDKQLHYKEKNRTQVRSEIIIHISFLGFPGGSEVKASASNVGDPRSIPGSGRSPGEGNGKEPPRRLLPDVRASLGHMDLHPLSSIYSL